MDKYIVTFHADGSQGMGAGMGERIQKVYANSSKEARMKATVPNGYVIVSSRKVPKKVR